ncbi:hypothetical protein J2Y73_002789 [Peribacillus frigoritolerans]|nr:hypothetical protein [Peribacillus frigoritolerans]
MIFEIHTMLAGWFIFMGQLSLSGDILPKDTKGFYDDLYT